MTRIQDFGNKIGGAKKDLWKVRGLMLDDLLDMNDAERNKHIKKDNVWKKPDYQKMLDEGLPIRVIYFIKTIRDSLPAKPQRVSHEYQDGYISFISDIRDKTMSITTEDEILNYFDNVMLTYVEKSGYNYIPLTSTYGCLNNKVFKAAQIRNLISLDRKIKEKQFLYTEDEKILDKYSFFKYQNINWTTDYNDRTRMDIKMPYGTSYVYPKGEYAIEENWQADSYFVLDSRNNIVMNNLTSLDEAQRIIIENEKQVQSNKEPANRKKKFIPKQLQHIERVGDNYRNNHNIIGDDMLNVFGFYGGEFGNWLNEKDKQQNLNYSYDAFADLAKTLNISNRDIALNGELSIAYGARGSAGAAAHYEPERRVINLTKMSGAGSLAHEWGHALDHYLGRIILNTETFLTSSNNEIIKPLLDAMKYRTLQGDEAKTQHQKEYEEYKQNIVSSIKYYSGYNSYNAEQKNTADKIIDEMINQYVGFDYYCAVKYEGKEPTALTVLSNIKKQNNDKGILKADRENIVYHLYSLSEKRKQLEEPITVQTEYYKNSIAMDKIHSKEDKGYWQSNCEMFARAFACYVKDKLSPDRSDYLCGHAESCVGNDVLSKLKNIKAYPEGEERKAINQCFDKLIEMVKERGIFNEYNQEKFMFNIHQENDGIDNISNYDFEQTSFFDYSDNYEPDICDNMF